jgi:hypothetical protein
MLSATDQRQLHHRQPPTDTPTLAPLQPLKGVKDVADSAVHEGQKLGDSVKGGLQDAEVGGGARK